MDLLCKFTDLVLGRTIRRLWSARMINRLLGVFESLSWTQPKEARNNETHPNKQSRKETGETLPD